MVLCLVLPGIAVVGIGLMGLMPGCTGGSSGPASGCYLSGLDLNWLVQLSVVSFVGSFIVVPIGVLFVVLSAVVRALSKGDR